MIKKDKLNSAVVYFSDALPRSKSQILIVCINLKTILCLLSTFCIYLLWVNMELMYSFGTCFTNVHKNARDVQRFMSCMSYTSPS